MKLKAGTLALGTRRDAATWGSGCMTAGLDLTHSVRKSTPSLEEVRDIFNAPLDWLYLGGHFSGRELYNEDHSFGLKFEATHIEVRQDGSAVARLSPEDSSMSLGATVAVVLWGGCSVCGSAETVRVLRKLFRNHTLLGFAGLTGQAIVDAMLGGGFMKKSHFFRQVEGDIADPDLVAQAWMRAAKAGYGGGSIESIFRAVDYSGQGWMLRDGKIVRWNV